MTKSKHQVNKHQINKKKLPAKAEQLFFLQYIMPMIIGIMMLTFVLFAQGSVLIIAALISKGVLLASSIGYIVGVIMVPIVILVFFFGVPILICRILARFTYKNYYYALTKRGFYKEHGIISKRYVTIPYGKIQNIDIHRNILERILGLSQLRVQTAGASLVRAQSRIWGAGAEGILPGLTEKLAEELRDELLDRADKARNQDF